MAVHPSTLLDDGHLAALADEVRDPAPARARPDGDTIALVTADAEGNAVSLIQSLFWGFGSGILEPETGIAAQNRGACFTLEPGHPNRFAPGARPFHTLMPVLVHRAGELAGVAGTMGGYQQPQINLHTLTRAFVAGQHPADAVAAPRWVVLGADEGRAPTQIAVEPGVPEAATAALRDAGAFELTEEDAFGHAHLIRRGLDGLRGRLGPAGRWFRGGRLSRPRPFGSGAAARPGCDTGARDLCPILRWIPPDRMRSRCSICSTTWTASSGCSMLRPLHSPSSPKARRRLLGYAPQAWLADPGFRTDLLHPEDRTRILETFERVRADGRPLRRDLPPPRGRRLLAMAARRRPRDGGRARRRQHDPGAPGRGHSRAVRAGRPLPQRRRAPARDRLPRGAARGSRRRAHALREPAGVETCSASPRRNGSPTRSRGRASSTRRIATGSATVYERIETHGRALPRRVPDVRPRRVDPVVPRRGDRRARHGRRADVLAGHDVRRHRRARHARARRRLAKSATARSSSRSPSSSIARTSWAMTCRSSTSTPGSRQLLGITPAEWVADSERLDGLRSTPTTASASTPRTDSTEVTGEPFVDRVPDGRA